MPVYMIQAGADGPIKIGTSSNPLRRMAALQVGNPVELRLVRVLEGGIDAELELHNRLHDSRMMGEWFILSPDTLANEALFANLPCANLRYVQPILPLIRLKMGRPKLSLEQRIRTRVIAMRLPVDMYDQFVTESLEEGRPLGQYLKLMLHGEIPLTYAPNSLAESSS